MTKKIFTLSANPHLVSLEAFVAVMVYVLDDDRDLVRVDYNKEMQEYLEWREQQRAFWRKEQSGAKISDDDCKWMKDGTGCNTDTKEKFVARQRMRRM